ncbi:hypothetical protein VNO77_13852 [Canavalia gladiata]|uniref:Uncharacterized protein n=1 Tax=Canavalia gladiata TaxID=3824 RepID=A0AAN9QRR9_CANGL
MAMGTRLKDIAADNQRCMNEIRQLNANYAQLSDDVARMLEAQKHMNTQFESLQAALENHGLNDNPNEDSSYASHSCHHADCGNRSLFQHNLRRRGHKKGSKADYFNYHLILEVPAIHAWVSKVRPTLAYSSYFPTYKYIIHPHKFSPPPPPT